jgi:hypothetical protein
MQITSLLLWPVVAEIRISQRSPKDVKKRGSFVLELLEDLGRKRGWIMVKDLMQYGP